MSFTAPSTAPLRIGCAAGFSGDRWDGAATLVSSLAQGQGAAALVFETLAERTLALAQLRQRAGSPGWEPALERFVGPVLPHCVQAGIPIVGNFGAADPRGAAACLHRLATAHGLPGLRIAVVEGDDLKSRLDPQQMQRMLPESRCGQAPVSANAYLGAAQIAQALRAGAQVVVTGRIADPALALGPALAHFDWAMDDWDRLAAATMAGHLIECGAQVTGGYFAVPGVNDVPDLARVGYPIVEIHEDGRIVIGKPPGTGGRVDRRTVTEQLLYEIHDPSAYLTPDVVADISEADLCELTPDRVEVTGIRGRPRPDHLKVTVCFEGGWLAEGEISYAGAHAASRAQLAADLVRRRLQQGGLGHLALRCDLVGVASVFADDPGRWWQAAGATASSAASRDVRLRLAAACADRAQADAVAREVTALYTCGPSAGGGIRTHVTPRLASESCFVPRDWLAPTWSFVE